MRPEKAQKIERHSWSDVGLPSKEDLLIEIDHFYIMLCTSFCTMYMYVTSEEIEMRYHFFHWLNN